MSTNFIEFLVWSVATCSIDVGSYSFLLVILLSLLQFIQVIIMVSCADIVKKFNLSDGQINGKCSSSIILLKVHKKMTGWRNIAPYLFTFEKGEEIVEIINQDLTLDDLGRRRKLLFHWKKFHGSDATYKKLIDAFLSADRQDLAEIVCDGLSHCKL